MDCVTMQKCPLGIRQWVLHEQISIGRLHKACQGDNLQQYVTFTYHLSWPANACTWEESSSLFTKNKENMSRLSTLPMGSITPQQSQHLDIHIWWSFARTWDISMDMQVAAQANNLTDKVMQGLYYEKRNWRLDDRVPVSQLTEMSSPPLHSGLLLAR